MYAATCAAPGVERLLGRRGAGRAHRDRQPRDRAPRAILRSAPAGRRASTSGRRTSTGWSGPVCEPGETPASEEASISSRPPPLAFAGTGPPRSGPAPRAAATRSARAMPSWPSGARGVELQDHDRAGPLGLRRAAPRGRRGEAGRSGPGPRSPAPASSERSAASLRRSGAGERRPTQASRTGRARGECGETHGGASYRAGRAEIRRILVGPHERGHRSPPGGRTATGGPSRAPVLHATPDPSTTGCPSSRSPCSC